MFNQIGCLTKDKITYCAKASTSVTLVSLQLSDIQEIAKKRKDIRSIVKRVIKAYSDDFNKPLIDYSSSKFYHDDEKESKTSKFIRLRFQNAVYKAIQYRKFER